MANRIVRFPPRLPCVNCGEDIDLVTDQIVYGRVMLVVPGEGAASVDGSASPTTATSGQGAPTPTACICGVCRMSA